MKKLILITLLLNACVSNSYTKPESDEVYKQIGSILQQQAGYLNIMVLKVYAKEIAACKAKSMGLDLKTGECIADQKPEPKKN